MWLIFAIQVRAAPRALRPGAAPKAVLSGIMALLLWIAATLAVSDALHQTLHHDANTSGHFCLICSLMKGQAGRPELPLALVVGALSVLFCFCLAVDSLLPGTFDYCVSLGRAPPVL